MIKEEHADKSFYGRCVMAEIKWEKDFEAALERAKKEGKSVFHDFWFDG